MSAPVPEIVPKIILDAMGGDHGPRSTLEGALEALQELSLRDGELHIVGDESILRPLLEKRRFSALAHAIAEGDARPRFRVRLLHAPESIDMEDSIRAVRAKPRASINVGCETAARDYLAKRPSAFVSAGHSGAVMASALLHMGRLPGCERPAIAVQLPTLSPDGCLLLDVGANVDCKPRHLRDFAVMGALYSQVERKSRLLPRVGLLSNGEERSKGNELTRAALEIIEGLGPFRPGPGAIGEFVGYSEGREIFKGQVDVVVADGFVGNVVLKSLEGLGSAVVTLLKREARSNWFSAMGFVFSSATLRRLKRKLDYAEYGAAPLLGVAGYAYICHGRSNPRAIKNALLRARSGLESRFVERMAQALLEAAEGTP